MTTALRKAHDTTTARVRCVAFALHEQTTGSRMPPHMPFQAVGMRGGADHACMDDCVAACCAVRYVQAAETLCRKDPP
jgi:hypothetical protein